MDPIEGVLFEALEGSEVPKCKTCRSSMKRYKTKTCYRPSGAVWYLAVYWKCPKRRLWHIKNHPVIQIWSYPSADGDCFRYIFCRGQQIEWDA